MRKNCRIWWPKQLSSTKPSLYNLLFGWFVPCSSDSLDIVVAFASNRESSSYLQSRLLEILHSTNGNMHVSLQDKSKFSLLGQCRACLSNGQVFYEGVEEDDLRKSGTYSVDGITECCRQWSSGCCNLDGLLEQCRQTCIESDYWIELTYDSFHLPAWGVCWIPKLHHIHWNGELVSHCDIHVIFYETPTYGAHHFSLRFWNSSVLGKTSLKEPQWVDELQQKQPLNDLDTVILAINSATAAKKVFERNDGFKRSSPNGPIIWMFCTFMWHILAMSMASLSTLFYIFIQFSHSFLNFGSQSWVYSASAKAFSNTWVNVQIRCCQVLYWPVFLQDNDLRSQSSVDCAEKVALLKHSMWSSLVVDIIMGDFIGLALLLHTESVCSWVSNFASDSTNELMRSGCVWLMGVPAGFKLNTELAGVLGMISLNMIQIWSTLWIFVGTFFIYFIKGLAILAILFGLTIPSALVIDMIAIATLHVSTLHWLISILYSQQLHVLAALWRLFRGRKWNPLRQRLDSFDYTVKQHVVGSLLFTPLLLLLPTTSVFYIFFTILNTAIGLSCMFIEVIISVIHATPYIKIVLRLIKPRRFPSGIWFEIIACHNNSSDSPWSAFIDKNSLPFEEAPERVDMNRMISSSLISILHSNYLSIEKLFRESLDHTLPHQFLDFLVVKKLHLL
ncbi:phosphatidylinositol N-acetylglucosaminyltransferase subunit GPI1-like isoform X2 [Durio zibethinus]|uniref:Phosphatidylinositol N-acetylglucosaminyltransferase subunit GPI1-like isoform X2 n=1 Tax=Durio zibethinus TaxID=66656 RepID=A0A6P5X599_DURZI|nr:phosphatidylinositol N-acetylglucosaminyltransferase subunit GPI1-like isoform X2 [Durio zibethinus]